MATFDLDIVHSRSEENLKRLQAALRSLEARYRDHPAQRPEPDLKLLAGPGHHLLMTRGGPLDVLGEVSGSVGYEGLLPEAEEITLDAGLRIRILSLPALIRLKALLGREKDRATLAILRRALDEQS